MNGIFFRINRRFNRFIRESKESKIYKKNLKEYIAKNQNHNFDYDKKFKYPYYGDRSDNAGYLGSYFWQDLWCAKKIFENNPQNHFDIGSRIDGFIAHLASFRTNIKLIDIRPLQSQIPGVDFVQADATNLDGIENDSIESLSALCSLEHFGLGRYGDPVDPTACFKAFESITRVVKQGGNIYIAVPIGKEHLEFDAHRVFYASTIVDAFSKFELIEFSSIHEYALQMEENIDIHKYDNDEEYGGLRFGLFHFRKK